MRCPKCGSDINEHTTECPKCGTPIIKIKPLRVCTNCGSEVPDDADICPGCGRTIKRRAHQTADRNQKTENAETGNKSQKFTGTNFTDVIKKDRYAWMQAVIPGILALLYHWFMLRDQMGFNLVNTLIIFEALVFFFGYHDIKDITKRPEMMDGLVFSEKFIYLSYFLPVLSLWDRRKLPGMDRKAMYPVIHMILFTLLLLSIMISMDANLIASMNTSSLSLNI